MTDPARDAVDTSRLLDPGTSVEVRDGFQGHWHGGYVIDSIDDDGARYRVRRASDDSVLPEALPRTSIRRERRASMWWI